jgi:integrase
VTALKWPDIDEERRTIRIRRAQWEGRTDETKTGTTRTLLLAPVLLEVLRAHRRELVGAARGLGRLGVPRP